MPKVVVWHILYDKVITVYKKQLKMLLSTCRRARFDPENLERLRVGGVILVKALNKKAICDKSYSYRARIIVSDISAMGASPARRIARSHAPCRIPAASLLLETRTYRLRPSLYNNYSPRRIDIAGLFLVSLPLSSCSSIFTRSSPAHARPLPSQKFSLFFLLLKVESLQTYLPYISPSLFCVLHIGFLRPTTLLPASLFSFLSQSLFLQSAAMHSHLTCTSLFFALSSFSFLFNLTVYTRARSF